MNKETIKSTLAAIPTGDFLDNTKALLATLGYKSDRTADIFGSVDEFIEEYEAPTPNTKTEQEFRQHVKSVQFIFQLTSDEITDTPQLQLFDPAAFDKGNTQCFLFCAVELKESDYSRTKYAEFTREINKRLSAPTVILFRAGDRLTVAFADRRPNITNESLDVLGQVTLIKDIRLNNPHRAHLDILSELSLESCVKWINENRKQENFDGLLAAWIAKLDTEELNKQFYKKLFAWFEWAVQEAKFPTDKNRTLKPEEHVIRLITRLLFIWFIKEKGLVADALFNKAQIQDLLAEDDFDNGDSYYRAILQNLFFATLNTEIDKRKFSKESYDTNRDFSCYRYKKQMDNPDKLLSLFAQTPFINGGLFDCLDTFKATGPESYRIDCFSDNQYHKLSIPNRLFFHAQQGLIPLLEHYKFTVEENTPIDQEVALDPELLGRVFENLLAAINPETGETARKMTGSYYTPRAIVDYMVDEVLIATLSQKCQPTDGSPELWDERLHYLFDYAKVCNDASEWFDDTETDAIVKTISELKILDPAVGSGAFPMGVLHKLTLALRRLDPDNTRWENLQKQLAATRAAAAFDTQDDQERRNELHEIDDTFKRYRDSDFGRKLYLIQNSIFGVDIQPIACQIAKLRFFISLAIEQQPDTGAENFGIKPLPNLETRFVAANTLIGLKQQMSLKSEKASQLEQALRHNREKHFHATTRQQKRACKDRDEELRAELATELKSLGAFADDADNIAQWDPYDQNATVDWFDPELMFGVTHGFDVVIGNPPYGVKILPVKLKQIKAKLQDTGNSNSAALFIDYGKNQFIKSQGTLAFIVPKSLLYSKTWQSLAFTLSEKATVLVDVERAFERVLLEQVVFIYRSEVENDFYKARKFINHTFTQTTEISRTYPKTFEAWICSVSSNEIQLGLKLNSIGTRLSEVSYSKRGLSVQKFLKTTGEVKVIGGKDISPYGIDGMKGFVDREILDSADEKVRSLLQPKVISQNIVTAKKIRATVDKTGDILGVDTVENTFVTDPNFNLNFIAALFNSKIVNWYAHRFIFCSALLTMHFDNYYVGKIPIPLALPEEQQPIIELVDQILAAKAADPDADTTAQENEIDKLVYELYNLTEEEIAIVEGSLSWIS